MFLFYTDGLNEAMNEHREEYGMDRIFTLINNTKQENAQIIHTRLIESVNDFRNETEQNDDISVVVVKVEY
jgi:serine phosphatase RsbU (regulator of sigma subunit)